ncbi:hypothetical protein [Corynebacterium glyciniphilum]|uniref:hypothetical protein n=1 Tax=Corynebacterium glyciniphilum TaxID=1404244 RepID=UPI0011AB4E2F|nr:hypothetical protein [Corynebacterium glyciniphilum]
MKLKKTLLAGATAATVAFAGVGVASAQEGSTDLPTSSISQSSEEGSGEGSSTSEISGSLDDLFEEDGILGSFGGEDWIEGIGNIGNVAGAVAGIIGLIGAILAFI